MSYQNKNKMMRTLKITLLSLIFTTLLSSGVFADTKFADPCSENLNNDNYDASIVSVRNRFKVEAESEFEVKVFLLNTGENVWHGENSKCNEPKMRLGTDRNRDRASGFFDELTWISESRIAMDQAYVFPGEVASFTFKMKTNENVSAFKEYFAPVVDGKKWINLSVHVRFMTGYVETEMAEVRQMMKFAASSGDVLQMMNLEGKRTLHVDLSEQIMQVKIGDTVIREFPVSTGAWSTPTPVGTHKILGKNDVRIGGASPHYIMPRFQMLGVNGRGFTGYGIHALPSLGSSSLRNKIRSLQARGEEVPHELYENDVLWTEAWDHLGTPVSHGCIRVSPDDADFLFEFTEIGGEVVVVR